MLYINIHQTEESTVVAVCDEELLGKTIEDEKRQLVVSKEFYGGEKKSAEEVIEILKEASNVNLIGNEAVDCGVKAGLIDEEAIITIGGIKHAQFYIV